MLVAHEPGTTIGGSHIRGSMVRASEAGYEEVDLVLPGTGRYIFFSFAKTFDNPASHGMLQCSTRTHTILNWGVSWGLVARIETFH